MIIELFGLPGAGKTTIANALEKQGAIIVRAPSGWRLLWEAFLFECAHPIRALRIAIAVVTTAARGTHYTLYVNGYLQSAAKWIRATRLSQVGKIAVIDQGHAQLVASLGGVTPATLAAFPRPNLLALVEAPREVRTERMQARGRTPREEFGESVAQSWDDRAARAIEEALPEFISHYPKVVRIVGEASPDESARVLLIGQASQ